MSSGGFGGRDHDYDERSGSGGFGSNRRPPANNSYGESALHRDPSPPRGAVLSRHEFPPRQRGISPPPFSTRDGSRDYDGDPSRRDEDKRSFQPVFRRVDSETPPTRTEFKQVSRDRSDGIVTPRPQLGGGYDGREREYRRGAAAERDDEYNASRMRQDHKPDFGWRPQPQPSRDGRDNSAPRRSPQQDRLAGSRDDTYERRPLQQEPVRGVYGDDRERDDRVPQRSGFNETRSDNRKSTFGSVQGGREEYRFGAGLRGGEGKGAPSREAEVREEAFGGGRDEQGFEVQRNDGGNRHFRADRQNQGGWSGFDRDEGDNFGRSFGRGDNGGRSGDHFERRGDERFRGRSGFRGRGGREDGGAGNRFGNRGHREGFRSQENEGQESDFGRRRGGDGQKGVFNRGEEDRRFGNRDGQRGDYSGYQNKRGERGFNRHQDGNGFRGNQGGGNFGRRGGETEDRFDDRRRRRFGDSDDGTQNEDRGFRGGHRFGGDRNDGDKERDFGGYSNRGRSYVDGGTIEGELPRKPRAVRGFGGLDVELKEIYEADSKQATEGFHPGCEVTMEGAQGDIPKFTSFENMGLCPEILDNLAKSSYTQPKNVQSAVIPLVLNGQDVVCQAETASGKTAAFAIPIIERLKKVKEEEGPVTGKGRPYCIILVPTRPLVIQLGEQYKKLAAGTGVSISHAYGGLDLELNRRNIAKGCDVLIATPGRLLDFFEKGDVKLEALKILVFDEIDKLLLNDEGWRQIEPILNSRHMKSVHQRQTLLYSATVETKVKEAIKAVNLVKSNCAYLSSGSTINWEKIHQRFERLSGIYDCNEFVYKLLQDDLETCEGKEKRVKPTLIFVSQCSRTKLFAIKFAEMGIASHFISSDEDEKSREETIRRFRTGEIQVLTTSDISERGLDVHGLERVIQYDIATDLNTYLHRIGRTGRLKAGEAISLVNIDNINEMRVMKKVVKLMEEHGKAVPGWLKEEVENIADEPEESNFESGFGRSGGFGTSSFGRPSSGFNSSGGPGASSSFGSPRMTSDLKANDFASSSRTETSADPDDNGAVGVRRKQDSEGAQSEDDDDEAW